MLNSSIEVWRGSEAELESTQESISTFESDEEEAFVAEKQNESESDNEEPDYMPELAPALNKNNQENETPLPTPAETEELNEPSVRGIEEIYGIKLDENEFYCLAGRGNSFTSTKTEENEFAVKLP